MNRPDNPRFPHTCIITRQPSTTPMKDEVIEDDPMADEVEVTEEEEKDDKEEVQVIYEGECRAYDKNTTSDKGDVITSNRGLALPLTRDDWSKLGVVPREGDSIKVDRGGYLEYGKIIDKNPGNFGGTHLVWRFSRN